MNSTAFARKENPFATLRRMARPRPSVEQCEFCSLPLQPGHRHLLEVATRKIICACDACALRFENVIGRWKLIPRDTRQLLSFRMTDAEWAGFSLPIELAFFFRSTPAGKVIAMYPSPAGATESLLAMESWEALAGANPALTEMRRDVEALLVNRLKGVREYYIVPIDLAFELVGLIRLHWRGFSGGDRVWQEIETFFSKLRQHSTHSTAALEEVSHA
ncbi:MAG TPA: DUF5947 family protein [Candidatus Angelobacter sp.]|nr:DUF5947 family protein [Candidatus Angelobacter sp.]